HELLVLLRRTRVVQADFIRCKIGAAGRAAVAAAGSRCLTVASAPVAAGRSAVRAAALAAASACGYDERQSEQKREEHAETLLHELHVQVDLPDKILMYATPVENRIQPKSACRHTAD